MTEQGNLHRALEQKVFYVYGIPKDQQGSAKVENFFRENGVQEVSVVGDKMRVVVHAKESIETMRGKFTCFEGHDLSIMPELLKEYRVQIDEKWIEVKNQYRLKFKTILQGIGVKFSKTAEGVFLIGSLEGINRASEIIGGKVEAAILKNELSGTTGKVNGHGSHYSDSGIHTGSEFPAESSAKASELATGSFRPNGNTVEKRLNNAAGSSDENDECDSAASAAGTRADVRSSSEDFLNDPHSRNHSTSTNSTERITADQRADAKDQATSSGRCNGSAADAFTIDLEDWRLLFVKHFYPELCEPLVKLPTRDMKVKSKTYAYLSDEIKEHKIDKLIEVSESPGSVISDFLQRTNVLERLIIKSGDQLELLVNDSSHDNSVQIIGLPKDIDMLRKEVDNWRETLSRKAPRDCESLSGFKIKFIANFHLGIFENINNEFLMQKESDDVTQIFGTPDDLNKLRDWIKKHRIDHLQITEQRMPEGIDENACMATLRSLPQEIKVYLEFPSIRKIIIVGLREDMEIFWSVLKIRSDDTMNAAAKNLEQTSGSTGAVGPVSTTCLSTVNTKTNESLEGASSGAIGGRMEAPSKIFHLNDVQWQFTERFHSALFEQLTDATEQHHKMTKKDYDYMLDMIQKNNIDRVEKTVENAYDVETSILRRLAKKLPSNLKVLVSFPSNGSGVEIIGLPEDTEKWWIMLRNEIEVYKSDHSKKMPPASHAIQTYQLKYIKTFYSKEYEYIEDLHALKMSEKEVLFAGTFDELDKLKKWIRNQNIDRVENKTEVMPTFVDEEDCREVYGNMKSQMKLCLSFPARRMYEVIGLRDDIRSFKDKIEQREEEKKEKFLAKSAQTASSSRTRSGSSNLYGATSSSDKRFVFQTPLSSIVVEIAQGDLTKQRTEAIVNPCNGHLGHYGGAAKAIADAAGRDLIEDCKEYIRKNKLLKTSEVMHSRSGRLCPPIKYVIHASGPAAKEYRDIRQCQDVLENTFLNCFEHANDELLVDSLSVPAISSGTYGVPKDIVAQSTWNALMRFDDQMSKSSKTKYLKSIRFINIDAESTTALIKSFKTHWNVYLLDQESKVDAAQFAGSGTSSSTRRRSGSLSLPKRSSVEDQEGANGDTVKVQTSRGRIKQSDNSQESKSARGATSQVVPLIKSAPIKGSVVPSSAAESICCVCLKLKKMSSLITRGNCPHKCCVPCLLIKCKQCTGSARIDSGPPSARSLVRSPTGGSKTANDVERRPESPETTVVVHAKTERNRAPRRSASVGRSPNRTNDMSVFDQSEERSGSRANSSAATNSQPLQQDDNCCICMDKIDDPKKLGCGHVFCKDCIDQAFTHQPKCPSCGQIFGLLKGNQPYGKMTLKRDRNLHLEGYQGCEVIVITYDIPDGIQTADHPNPGKKFDGTYRTAYLPGNAEGEEVLRLLQKAFDAKLVFTIGKSNTTGRENVVVWNDIHHKTNTVGQYGYPDPTYLQRVKDELAAKGIKSDTVTVASSSAASQNRNSADKRVDSTTGGATGLLYGFFQRLLQ